MKEKKKRSRYEKIAAAKAVILAFAVSVLGIYYGAIREEESSLRIETAIHTEESESVSEDLKWVESTEESLVDERVNINQADSRELQTLPRIGPATAEKILEYRKQYGGFAAIEEIQNVKGIGKATFERLKDCITVD